MATFEYNPDRLVQCPYDGAHMLLQSRLQTHLTKCKLNNLDMEMKTCSFNAQHVVPASDFEHHLLSCPNRIYLDQALARGAQENEQSRGRTAVPNYSGPVLESSENWDDEIDPNGAAGYTPKNPAASAGLILDLEMTKPAERKKIYKQLASQTVENNNLFDRPVEEKKPASVYTRQPKFSHKSMPNTKSSGIGRGQPAPGPSAPGPSAPAPSAPAPSPSRSTSANAYNDCRQPMSSHSQINQMIPHVGIGRGRNVKYDLDFPALGSH